MKKDNSLALSAGDKDWQHPELKEGEVFLGNTKKNVFFKVYRSWKPKRMGEIPYDINGNEIVQRKNTSKLVPVFVRQSQVESRKRRAARFRSRKKH